MVPFSGKQMGLPAVGSRAGPHQLIAVGTEDRQAVEALLEGHTNRLGLSFNIDQEELEVSEPMEIVGEDQKLAGRMKVRGLGHHPQMGNLSLLAVGSHHTDFYRGAILGESPPDDLHSIGTEESFSIISLVLGQASHLTAIGSHQAKIHQIGLVPVENLLVLWRKLSLVGVTIG